MTPAELRAVLEAALQRRGPDAKDDDLASTFVSRRQPFPGMRCETLAHNENGERVYGVTVKQARRLLAALDEARL